MIYLDNNATTPVLPEVLDSMMPYFKGIWGNPSSSYRFSSAPKKAIDAARSLVASLINASPQEIIFTSCATESNNTALHAALSAHPYKKHIVTSNTEHASVLSCCAAYEEMGHRVTYLPVDTEGLISIDNVEAVLTPDTAVVSLMWANNETGVIFPVEAIANVCHSHGVPFHCDAVQAIGKVPVDVQTVRADYLSISGHKLGAPKGVGSLYVRKGSPFTPYILGGGQELSRRGGTENIPYIAGLGCAAGIAEGGLSEYMRIVTDLRNKLEFQVLEIVKGATVNGHKINRLPNTSNIHLPGINNTAALAILDQANICASSGSACMNHAISPSHVITAMTNSRKHAEESIRFSLGLDTDIRDIAKVTDKMNDIARLFH